MKELVLFILHQYKKYLSPILESLLGHACRYTPTCSDYSYLAIEKFGINKGLLLSVKRVLKCNPFFEGGYDPLPSVT